MHPALPALGRTCGYACTAIGLGQLMIGARFEPGFDPTDAPVDSQVRFLGPVFAGYGLAWIAAGSAGAPDVGRLRLLGGIMALGGAGRLVSRAKVGRPHAFQDALTAIELIWPATVEVLARSRPEPNQRASG